MAIATAFAIFMAAAADFLSLMWMSMLSTCC